MCSAIVLLPNLHYREIARRNWGLTEKQMKGMHVHHRIPISKGGSDAPENLYVCSPSFHANIWHNGYYKIIQNASEVARLGGLARQKVGFTPEGLEKRKKSSRIIGIENKHKRIGLFARTPEKRKEDARNAGKIGIQTTLSRNPNHMRDMGLKGGRPGNSVEVIKDGVKITFSSISKAIKYSKLSRTKVYNGLREQGFYKENNYYIGVV